jgi:hypothetical protein
MDRSRRPIDRQDEISIGRKGCASGRPPVPRPLRARGGARSLGGRGRAGGGRAGRTAWVPRAEVPRVVTRPAVGITAMEGLADLEDGEALRAGLAQPTQTPKGWPIGLESATLTGLDDPLESGIEILARPPAPGPSRRASAIRSTGAETRQGRPPSSTKLHRAGQGPPFFTISNVRCPALLIRRTYILRGLATVSANSPGLCRSLACPGAFQGGHDRINPGAEKLST